MDKQFEKTMYAHIKTFDYSFDNVACVAKLEKDHLISNMNFRFTCPIFDVESTIVPNIIYSPSLETIAKALTQTIAMIIKKYGDKDAIFGYALHHSQHVQNMDGQDLIHLYACRALRKISRITTEDPEEINRSCQVIPLYRDDPAALDEIKKMKL